MDSKKDSISSGKKSIPKKDRIPTIDAISKKIIPKKILEWQEEENIDPDIEEEEPNEESLKDNSAVVAQCSAVPNIKLQGGVFHKDFSTKLHHLLTHHSLSFTPSTIHSAQHQTLKPSISTSSTSSSSSTLPTTIQDLEYQE